MNKNNKKVLSPEEVARLKAEGEEKRQARANKVANKIETPAPATAPAPVVSELQRLTEEIIGKLEKTKDVISLIESKTSFSKRLFLDLLYNFIIQRNGRIKDGSVKRIMSFFTIEDYSNPHLRKRYLKCISATLRQRQVFIKDEIARFVMLLFKAGDPEYCILITMLEGEYISRKTYEILNDNEIVQVLIEARMGDMIIAKLKSIIENGGNLCPWTNEFTPATEVKLEMLKELLGRYKKTQTSYEFNKNSEMLGE